MTKKTIAIQEEHWRYLQAEATKSGTSLELLVAEMIETYMSWQKTLATDPISQLFGTIEASNPLEHEDIDHIVYQS